MRGKKRIALCGAHGWLGTIYIYIYKKLVEIYKIHVFKHCNKLRMLFKCS